MPVIVSSAVAHAMRAYGRTLPAKPLASALSRVILARPSFLIAPSVKSRGYATATKKKTTTTTTTTTKAKKPAVKKPAARKTAATAASKTKKTTSKAKKPVAKAAKPKKAAPKKVVKRKVVDPEKKKEKELLELRRELKRNALIHKEPLRLPNSPWSVYINRLTKGSNIPTGSFGGLMKEASATFKTLDATELRHLAETAQENQIQNALNYKKWVDSHTPLEIHNANNARRRLSTRFGIKVFPARIVDDRLPKAPSSSFAQFVKAQINNRDGKVSEVVKALGAEWKTMSTSDKKPYTDLAAAESGRYALELEKLKA
ncbi:hypothetical protein BD289DRAFT_446233 [Coniella lustricola]|uniref:HMG box domain-containing protein n=1 Tax=Coniella lustricola TaxID=2025994 RepID=A0A2T2ZU46_9PEZI|nr:hypothetical protein BD289DRAFT_446233 [Coniella lustricola]